ncbi:BamA/TamA family outer membrane protein [uncultured Prevotella sp.]|uniref:BamA/TamA family outer membrane protein n=1 Tax=uncultured Prevotella sp. TaxID=159272 RepID=UPI0027E26393|nr:BamA/TamA family outer membrane protein [uncultured Prevotella sp.]
MLFVFLHISAVEKADTIRRHGFITRLLDYFNDANKEKKDKRFDFSIIGGPHYSTDTKLGLGLVAAGLYRSDPNDTLQPPSNVSLFGDVSTVGFYMLGVSGTHIFPGDRQRIDYTTYFYSFPCYYWGMGYDMGNNNDNKSEMKDWQAQMKASWLFATANDLFIGPTIAFDYIHGSQIERPDLLNGQRATTYNIGAGFTLLYDTRDNLTAPKRGVYLSLQQLFRPRFMGNKYAFSTTDLHTSGYVPLWKGATLAADFRTLLNFGNPSWAMMALLGDSYSMRGYYEGRYRDKNKIETQIELRQHIWRRNGIVLWAGAGTVFPKFSEMRMSHVLPNYGLGYRWEFKKNVNVRLDYGFGKAGQSSFIFNINEAF